MRSGLLNVLHADHTINTDLLVARISDDCQLMVGHAVDIVVMRLTAVRLMRFRMPAASAASSQSLLATKHLANGESLLLEAHVAERETKGVRSSAIASSSTSRRPSGRAVPCLDSYTEICSRQSVSGRAWYVLSGMTSTCSSVKHTCRTLWPMKYTAYKLSDYFRWVDSAPSNPYTGLGHIGAPCS